MHTNAEYNRVFDTAPIDLMPWQDSPLNIRTPMWTGSSTFSGHAGSPGTRALHKDELGSSIGCPASGYFTGTLSQSIASMYYQKDDEEQLDLSQWGAFAGERMQQVQEQNIQFPLLDTGISPPFSIWHLQAMERLRGLIDDNLIGADAKWMLFVSTVMSYRNRQLMRACAPPTIRLPLDNWQLDALSVAVSAMPDTLQLQRHLSSNRMHWGPMPDEQVALFHWVLIESRTPQLRPLLSNERQRLWVQLGQQPMGTPSWIFQVGDEGVAGIEGKMACPSSVWFYYAGALDALYPMICDPSFTDPSHPDYDGLFPAMSMQSDLVRACELAPICHSGNLFLCGSLIRTVAVCQIGSQGQLIVRYLLVYTVSVSRRPILSQLMAQWQEDGILQPGRANAEEARPAGRWRKRLRNVLKHLGRALSILANGRSW